MRRLWLFEGLSDRELAEVASRSDAVDVLAGQTLVKQDSLAHEFCVIEQGTAEVRRDGDLLNELGPGDFFGEIGILETARRTATVTASTPMRLVVMHERDLRTLNKDVPAVADKLRAAIRARLGDHSG